MINVDNVKLTYFLQSTDIRANDHVIISLFPSNEWPVLSEDHPFKLNDLIGWQVDRAVPVSGLIGYSRRGHRTDGVPHAEGLYVAKQPQGLLRGFAVVRLHLDWDEFPVSVVRQHETVAGATVAAPWHVKLNKAWHYVGWIWNVIKTGIVNNLSFI